MSPTTSHLVGVKVKDIFSAYLEGASVVVTHVTSSETLSETTNSVGEAVVNLGSLTSWTLGDSLSIFCSKSGEGSKTLSTTISSGPGQTHTITLEEEQQVHGIVTSDQAKINKAMLVDFNKDDIKHSNPVPIIQMNKNGVIFDQYSERLSYSGGLAQYVGRALPGTTTGEAKWQIHKLVYSGNYITQKVWAGGNDRFNKIWTNRTTYSYS